MRLLDWVRSTAFTLLPAGRHHGVSQAPGRDMRSARLSIESESARSRDSRSSCGARHRAGPAGDRSWVSRVSRRGKSTHPAGRAALPVWSLLLCCRLRLQN